MRDLNIIIQDNGNNGIVLREAIKVSDFDTIDLLSCGSGYDITDDDLQFYLEHKSFEGWLFANPEF